MFPWIAAILLGALAPALIVAGLSANLVVLPLAFAVTLAHSIILGLPVALLYRARRWTRLGAVIAGAFLIGAIPGGLVTWPMRPSLKGTASVDGITTMIDGVPTLAGWLGYLESLAIFGAYGAAGGFVFWLTLRWSGVLTVTYPEATRPMPSQSRIGILLAAAAVTTSVAVAALPSITKDRSCHNMFRDGRGSVVPKVRIDLDIAMDDWPRLTNLLEQFGASHNMSFRSSNEGNPAVKVLGLSACTEEGLVITADEQRWASRNYASPIEARGVPIGVFDLNDGTGWQPLARQLVAVLDSEWRGKVRFRDGNGRLVPESAVLAPQTNSPPSR
jgi:hypothetical protein